MDVEANGKPHGNPGRRPIQVEFDSRVAFATELLCAGKSNGEIKRAVAEKYGISQRTVERIARRARAGMVEATGKDVDEMRRESIAVYQAIIDGTETEPRDKIKARERIDKLLGLEVHWPRKVEVSGSEGGPIQTQAAVVQVDVAAKLAECMENVRRAVLWRPPEQRQEAPAIE